MFNSPTIDTQPTTISTIKRHIIHICPLTDKLLLFTTKIVKHELFPILRKQRHVSTQLPNWEKDSTGTRLLEHIYAHEVRNPLDRSIKILYIYTECCRVLGYLYTLLNIDGILEPCRLKINQNVWTFCYFCNRFRNSKIMNRNDHPDYSCIVRLASWNLLSRLVRQPSTGYWQLTQQIILVPRYYLLQWMDSSRGYEQAEKRNYGDWWSVHWTCQKKSSD